MVDEPGPDYTAPPRVVAGLLYCVSVAAATATTTLVLLLVVVPLLCRNTEVEHLPGVWLLTFPIQLFLAAISYLYYREVVRFATTPMSHVGYFAGNVAAIVALLAVPGLLLFFG